MKRRAFLGGAAAVAAMPLAVIKAPLEQVIVPAVEPECKPRVKWLPCRSADGTLVHFPVF